MLTEDVVRRELGRLLPPRTTGDRSAALGAGSDDLEKGRAFLATAVDGGWAVPTWPAELGGRGASLEEAALIDRVAKDFDVPDMYVYISGLKMVGPCVQLHGTREQQQRWLRPIADGSEIWCQMFSEPEAGSDLANVATRASRDGDEWVFDGQKVWTSRGTWARWGLCIARTDPEVPKHNGLTMFGIDMRSPGIEVRPLVQMNGDKHFSEVFMTGVRVPDSCRIGGPGEGWKVALAVLAQERAMVGEGGGEESAQTRAPSWLRTAADRRQLSSVTLRDAALRAFTIGEVARLTSARNAAEAASGRPGPAGSGAKLRSVQRFKSEVYFTKDAAGAAGMLTEHDGHIEFLTAPSMSIRGGTDEIQRNILGERVLGLPADPRPDRDAPWSRSRRGIPS